MPPKKKRDKFLGWLSRSFAPKGENLHAPDGPSRLTSPGGMFDHAHGFTLHNPVMTSIQADHYTVNYALGDGNLVPHVMGILSQRIIPGAAHDSSARSPPPRCHPETRVKLIARITAWFEGQGPREFVLWITGPAGVGKSAVVQTFAEYLVKFELLGASVFFSRPNKRNNPHGVFITIAYQLAARIEAYRNFVVERISRDPELVNGDMQTQFRTFIVEPFVGKKIGAGGKRWGILLDGLDELKGEDAQCEIIRLITTFAHENVDAPLVWIIASRPETHISDKFDDPEVRRSCWLEDIPIDSTEACEDVDRFLRSEFEAIRKKFRRSVPRDWPTYTDYLKLTVAASGLFIYAQVVMQFIQDPEYSDPGSKFRILLSVIDRSNASATKENPFFHLDMLYHEILCAIPSNLWPAAKRLLRCTVHWNVFTPYRTNDTQTLRGMSILLGLSPHVIYTCLLKCQSILRVPDWKVAHTQTLTFLHASFTDYLKDLHRSGAFYVGSAEEAVDDIDRNVLAILSECGRDDAGPVETAWRSYCSKLDDEPPSRAMTKYNVNALRDIATYFARRMESFLQAGAESSIYAQLYNVHMIKVSYYFDPWAVVDLVDNLMSAEVEATGLLRWAHLKDLKFGHLDWKMMSPVRVWDFMSLREDFHWVMHRPRSKTALKKFVSELETLVETSPLRKVVIFGGVPNGRIAVFCNPLKPGATYGEDFMFYLIPCPE